MALKDGHYTDAEPQDIAPTKSKVFHSSNDPTQRLGIRQLGWFAHEQKAPAKVLELMGASKATVVPNIITILAKASEQDTSVRTTYFCHPSVQYIGKLQGEGSFCGYRNIQMMISYMLGSKARGAEAFPNSVPSILELQDLIEDAWDRGINSDARLETGGIRHTRKHIGTPEAQALFKNLNIPCRVERFVASSGDEWYRNCCIDDSAFYCLLNHVERYFRERPTTNESTHVHITNAPPIYLQRPHHSLTVVGIEIRKDGGRSLLVLDPKSRPSQTLTVTNEVLRQGTILSDVTSLKACRRGRWNLGLYKIFETLSLDIQT